MRIVLLCVAAGVMAIHALGDERIRVVTYNIHHGEGTDKKIDVARIAAIVKEQQPDIVCLQEVDQGVARSQGIDIPAELAKALEMQVAYGPNLDLQGGRYGNATLTRLRIVKEENVKLPTPQGQEPRGCLRIRVEVGQQAVDVLNTHLGLTPEQRKEQAAAIEKLFWSGPIILAGDLNETSKDPALQTLTRALRDTGAAVDDTAGSVGHGERMRRIDFILASKDMDVISSRVVAAGEAQVASDHLPVVAEISLKAPVEGAKAQGIYDADDERVDEAVGEVERWLRRNSE